MPRLEIIEVGVGTGKRKIEIMRVCVGWTCMACGAIFDFDLLHEGDPPEAAREACVAHEFGARCDQNKKRAE